MRALRIGSDSPANLSSTRLARLSAAELGNKTSKSAQSGSLLEVFFLASAGPSFCSSFQLRDEQGEAASKNDLFREPAGNRGRARAWRRTRPRKPDDPA
jgi:hypothetical protein